MLALFILVTIGLVGVFFVPKVGEYIEMKNEKTRMLSQRSYDQQVREAMLLVPRVCPEHGDVRYTRQLRCPYCGSETLWGTPSYERWKLILQTANTKRPPESQRSAREIDALARKISEVAPRKQRYLKIVQQLATPEELGCI